MPEPAGASASVSVIAEEVALIVRGACGAGRGRAARRARRETVAREETAQRPGLRRLCPACGGSIRSRLAARLGPKSRSKLRASVSHGWSLGGTGGYGIDRTKIDSTRRSPCGGSATAHIGYAAPRPPHARRIHPRRRRVVSSRDDCHKLGHRPARAGKTSHSHGRCRAQRERRAYRSARALASRRRGLSLDSCGRRASHRRRVHPRPDHRPAPAVGRSRFRFRVLAGLAERARATGAPREPPTQHGPVRHAG